MKTLITVLACAAVAASSAFAGEYEDISITDLKKSIEDGKVVVLDVNGSASYAKGHIPTAVDYKANKENLAAALEGKGKDTLIVAYCGGPSCSAYKAGADAAKEMGFTNVKHLSAGISGWLQAGEKTEKAEADKS